MRPILLALLLSSAQLFAQSNRVLVSFYPDNKPFAGMTNYPETIQIVSFTTNKAGWSTNMSVDDFASVRSAAKASYISKQNTESSSEAQRISSLNIACDAEWSTLAEWKAKISKGEAKPEDVNKILENIIDVQLRIRVQLRNLYQPQ